MATSTIPYPSKYTTRWTGNANVSTGTYSSGFTNGKTLTTIPLTAGTWLLIGDARFPQNSIGERLACFHTSQDIAYTEMNLSNLIVPVSTLQCHVPVISIITVESDTNYYFNAWQNSGSTLRTYGYVQALKIA